MRGMRPVYPIATMNVGDKFFMPGKVREKLRPLCCYWQRKHPGKKFSVKSHEREGVKGWVVERWQ